MRSNGPTDAYGELPSYVRRADGFHGEEATDAARAVAEEAAMEDSPLRFPTAAFPP